MTFRNAISLLVCLVLCGCEGKYHVEFSSLEEEPIEDVTIRYGNEKMFVKSMKEQDGRAWIFSGSHNGGVRISFRRNGKWQTYDGGYFPPGESDKCLFVAVSGKMLWNCAPVSSYPEDVRIGWLKEL